MEECFFRLHNLYCDLNSYWFEFELQYYDSQFCVVPMEGPTIMVCRKRKTSSNIPSFNYHCVKIYT